MTEHTTFDAAGEARAIEERRLGIAKWRWKFTVERLKDAYDAACQSLDNDLARLQKRHETWQRSGPPKSDDRDEVDRHEHEGEWISERYMEAEHALELVRQGFVVVLFHSWERHALGWVDWKGGYKHHHVTAKLKKAGFVIHPGLHKLNNAANCIKHDGNELWKQDPDMFDTTVARMVEEGLEPSYGRFLKLSEIHMQGFFAALLASGPSQKPILSL